MTPMIIKVPTLLLNSKAIQELVFLSSARLSSFFGKKKDEPKPEWSKSQTLYCCYYCKRIDIDMLDFFDFKSCLACLKDYTRLSEEALRSYEPLTFTTSKHHKDNSCDSSSGDDSKEDDDGDIASESSETTMDEDEMDEDDDEREFRKLDSASLELEAMTVLASLINKIDGASADVGKDDEASVEVEMVDGASADVGKDDEASVEVEMVDGASADVGELDGASAKLGSVASADGGSGRARWSFSRRWNGP